MLNTNIDENIGFSHCSISPKPNESADIQCHRNGLKSVKISNSINSIHYNLTPLNAEIQINTRICFLFFHQSTNGFLCSAKSDIFYQNRISFVKSISHYLCALLVQMFFSGAKSIMHIWCLHLIHLLYQCYSKKIDTLWEFLWKLPGDSSAEKWKY